MKAIPVKLVALLTIVFILASCGGSGEKVLLKLNLEAGKTYKMETVIDQNITQTIEGTSQKMKQVIGNGFDYEVMEKDADGRVKIKVTYTSVYIKQESEMGSVEYDSKNPPAEIPPLAQSYAPLVGLGFTAKISATGKVSEISGIEEMYDKLIAEMDFLSGSHRTAVENALKEQFGETAITEMMEKAMTMYCSKPVGVGDSWTSDYTLTQGMPLEMKNKWTLKERKAGIAFVDVKSKVSINPDAPGLDMGGVKIKYDVSGDQSGSLEIDESTGWVQSSKLTQQLSGTLVMDSNPMMPDGMSWPITLESTITMGVPER